MEAITKIKLSEDKAKALVEDAISKKKEILKEADKLSKDKYESIVKSANSEKNELIEEAIKSGEQEAAPIFESGKVEVQEILHIDEEKIVSAVELIKKKVVNINGNS